MILAALMLLQGAWAPLPNGVPHRIQSTALGEPRDVMVVEPGGYSADSSRYPVIVLLDGDGLLPVGAGMLAFLERMGRTGGAILIGVRSNSPADRGRVFLPPGDSAMRGFLESELKPFIERRWRTTDQWILAGQSLSALFTLSTFARRESVFTGFVAISPVLGWRDGVIRRAAQVRVEQPRSRPVRLFLSTASEGERYPPTAVQSLDSTLTARRPPSIAWAYRQYPAEDHGSTLVPALFDGLRFVLPTQ